MRIVAIFDGEETRQRMKAVFRATDHQVDECDNFAAALELIGKEPVGALVLDREALEVMGYDSIGLLRRLRPQTAVLLATQRSEDFDRVSLEAGADAGLPTGLHPERAAQLLTQLAARRVIREHRVRASLERLVVCATADAPGQEVAARLADAGYAVTTVTSACRALGLVRDGRAHVLICANGLPDMDTRAVFAAAKRHDPDVMGVVVCHQDELVSDAAGLSREAEELVVMPIRPKTLLAAVDRAWRRWSLGATRERAMVRPLPTELRVLLYEANPDGGLLVQRSLGRGYEVTATSDIAEAVDLVAEQPFDVVLADLATGEAGAFNAFVRLRAGAPDVPMLLLCANEDDELIRRATVTGAAACIVKSAISPPQLAAQIAYVLGHCAVAEQVDDIARRLRSDEAGWRRLAERSADALLVVSEDRIVMYANRAAEDLFDLDIDRLVGSPVPFVARATTAIEVDIRLPRGQVRVGELRSVETVWADERALLCSIRDITAREAAVRQLRAMTEAIPIGVVAMHDNRNKPLFNRLGRDILRLDPGLGPHAGDIADDEVIDKLGFRPSGRCCGDEGPATEERSYGAQRYLVECRCISDDDEHLGTLVLLRDITLEQQLDEHKSEFASIVSHELRTPLTAIKNALDILIDNPSLAEASKRRMLEIAHRNNERMMLMVRDLLDLSRLEAGYRALTFSDTDPARIARSVVETLESRARGREVELVIDAGEPARFFMDAIAVERVLVNLLSNAIKYTREKSTVTIRVRSGPLQAAPELAPRAQMLRSFAKAEVVIDVTDQGVGIPEAEQGRIFEKFVRIDRQVYSKSRGTGLGLPIAQRLVSDHGGQLSLESRSGEGATFSFCVPAFDRYGALGVAVAERVEEAKRGHWSLGIIVLRVLFDDPGVTLDEANGETILSAATSAVYRSRDFAMFVPHHCELILLLEGCLPEAVPRARARVATQVHSAVEAALPKASFRLTYGNSFSPPSGTLEHAVGLLEKAREHALRRDDIHDWLPDDDATSWAAHQPATSWAPPDD